MTGIWAIEDVMLSGNEVRTVLRRVPLPSDTPDVAGLAKKRFINWHDANERLDAVRVVDSEGNEVARYSGWDLLRDRA